jgi:hypothetical protein
MLSNLKSILAIAVISLSLTACGGGGSESEPVKIPDSGGTGGGNDDGGAVGGGNDQTPEALSLSVNGSSSLNENSTTSSKVTVNGAVGNIVVSSIEYDYTDSANLLATYDTNGNEVTINYSTKDLKTKNNSIKITMTMRDEQMREIVWDETVVAVNTSGDEAASSIESIVEYIPELTQLKSEKLLAERFNELAAMINIKVSESGSLLADLESKVSDDYEIAEWKETVTLKLSNYLDGTGNEDDLYVALMNIELYTGRYFANVSNVLNNGSLALASIVDELNLGEVYKTKNGELSLFEGNPSLGQYVEEEWVFNEKSKYLTAIVFPESQLCNAE